MYFSQDCSQLIPHKFTIVSESALTPSFILEETSGYIIVSGTDITGWTKGIEYDCLVPFSEICTITAPANQVTDLGNGLFKIQKPYAICSGVFVVL